MALVAVVKQPLATATWARLSLPACDALSRNTSQCPKPAYPDILRADQLVVSFFNGLDQIYLIISPAVRHAASLVRRGCKTRSELTIICVPIPLYIRRFIAFHFSRSYFSFSSPDCCRDAGLVERKGVYRRFRLLHWLPIPPPLRKAVHQFLLGLRQTPRLVKPPVPGRGRRRRRGVKRRVYSPRVVTIR